MSGKLVDLNKGRENVRESLRASLDSHKEYVEAGATSLVVLTVDSGGDPAVTYDIAGTDKIRVLGALQVALHDLSNSMIKIEDK